MARYMANISAYFPVVLAASRNECCV